MRLLEFLNECSPLRAVSYMIFMLIILIVTYVFIETLIRIMFNKEKKSSHSEIAEDYYDGVIDEGDA